MDGGPVVTQTAGSGKGNIFMVLPRYQFLLTGAYQARWGINLGVNYVLREGFATPFYASDVLEDGEDILAATGKNVLLTTDVDRFRLPAVLGVDREERSDVRHRCHDQDTSAAARRGIDRNQIGVRPRIPS